MVWPVSEQTSFDAWGNDDKTLFSVNLCPNTWFGIRTTTWNLGYDPSHHLQRSKVQRITSSITHSPNAYSEVPGSETWTGIEYPFFHLTSFSEHEMSLDRKWIMNDCEPVSCYMTVIQPSSISCFYQPGIRLVEDHCSVTSGKGQLNI
jgi:hypothetical protein